MSTMSESTDFMRELLLNGQFSDMEIICQDVTFKAHQAIVCTQSKFFHSAICDGFKESLDRSINLKDETPETIERVLSFFYLKDYQDDGHTVLFRHSADIPPSTDGPDPVSPSEEDKSDTSMQALKARALNNILVFAAADKYGIDPLKNLASVKFSKWASKNWDSLIFPEVVEEALSMIPTHETKLQKIIAGVISSRIVELIERGTILPLLSSFGCLGTLVIMDLAQKGQDQDKVLQGLSRKLELLRQCRECSGAFNVRISGVDYKVGEFHCAYCGAKH